MCGLNKEAVNDRAAQVLRIVGLDRATDFYPYQLSGGMRHRVAVARAWALHDASVLLMDEPFSAIDAVNRMTLQKYLVDAWLEEPRTVIYVTHDIDEAIYLADRIAIMTPSPGSIATYVTSRPGASTRSQLGRSQPLAQPNRRTSCAGSESAVSHDRHLGPQENRCRRITRQRAVLSAIRSRIAAPSRRAARTAGRYRSLWPSPSQSDHRHPRDRQAHRRL